MTEKRFSVERFMNPKYYYGLDGNITDGENVYRTKNMPKEDVNEVFLDEKQLGSNSLMDCLNALNDENEQLKSENKRLTDKLNKTALELVDECISQGKATEISEMSYREFLDYRAENGKPMELQL